MKDKNFTYFFVLLYIFLNSTILLSQAWEGDVHWYYEQYDAFILNPDDYIAIIKEKDTIIQNRKCIIFKRQYIDFENGIKKIHTSSENLILEKIDKKINIYKPTKNEFWPLYDFSKNKNETFQTSTEGLGGEIIFTVNVNSTDTVDIGGLQVRVQNVSGNASGFYLYGSVFEDIGWGYYLFPTYGAIDPPPGGRILCYKDGEKNIIFDNFCDILSSTNIGQNESTDVKTYPNPAIDYINVEADGIFTEYSLYNSCSQLIKSDILYQNKIDISHLAKGSYELVLKNDNNVIHKRILKI
jgi:hypothetical protein